MTRDEAATLVRNFFITHGEPTGGLNEHGFGGAMIGSAETYFQHEAEMGTLLCRGLVHKFEEQIDRRVVRAFELMAKAGEMDTGGGRVEYMAENKGVYLTRSYTELLSDADFAREVEHLAEASLIWAHNAIERVGAYISASPETQELN